MDRSLMLLYDLDVPCPEALVILSNVKIFGTRSLGAEAVHTVNVVTTPRKNPGK